MATHAMPASYFYMTILLLRVSSFIACHGASVISPLLPPCFCIKVACQTALEFGTRPRPSRNNIISELLFGRNFTLPHIWWQRWDLAGQRNPQQSMTTRSGLSFKLVMDSSSPHTSIPAENDPTNPIPPTEKTTVVVSSHIRTTHFKFSVVT